jgi:hypothetical protein
MVLNPEGLATKNHCAGEGQQQLSSRPVLESDDKETWKDWPTEESVRVNLLNQMMSACIHREVATKSHN